MITKPTFHGHAPAARQAADEAKKLSPSGCMRSHGGGRPCDTCHAAPRVLHVPTRQRGAFCADCCPCCSREAKGAAA